MFSNYENFFLDQANSSSDPSQMLILKYLVPRTSLSPSPSLQHNRHHVLHRFPYFALINLITRHKYWIYKKYTKPSHSNFLSGYIQIIKTYGSNMLPIERMVLIRAASLSNVDNAVNNNSIFNTMCAKFFTK